MYNIFKISNLYPCFLFKNDYTKTSFLFYIFLSMKKSLVLWLLLIGSITLVWCQKSEWEPEVSESQYPVAQQVCLDNEWEVTVDDEWTPICLLGGRWINLADMEENAEAEATDEENIDAELPEWAKTSLTNEELDELSETNFPKGYSYTSFNMDENVAGDNGEVVYPEDLSHTLLIPEHATMASREITSSGIQDGMIYTDTTVTLQDGTIIKVLYIVDPVTLNFVAANVENGNISTNYQFVY